MLLESWTLLCECMCLSNLKVTPFQLVSQVSRGAGLLNPFPPPEIQCQIRRNRQKWKIAPVCPGSLPLTIPVFLPVEGVTGRVGNRFAGSRGDFLGGFASPPKKGARILSGCEFNR